MTAEAAYAYREEDGKRPDGPLLLVFHGTGGDENQLFGLARELMQSARVVAPRGDVLETGMRRFFRRKAEGVYDMDDLARRTGTMAAFVKDAAAANPHSAVLGLGYSNGANILASVMMARPELFDGAVLMHPLIPWEPEPCPSLKGKRVLVTAGRNDPICPAPLTQRLADWLTAQGASTDLLWHDGGHEVRPSEIEAARAMLASFEA